MPLLLLATFWLFVAAAKASGQQNIAPLGTAISGAAPNMTGSGDLLISNQGDFSELNDGVFVTDPLLLGVQNAFTISAPGDLGQNGNGIDTYGGGAANPFDFVGILFPEPQFGVSSVRVQHYIPNDGGWWGAFAGTVPARNGDPLDANELSSPLVQITKNGGASWTSIVTAESDYVSQYTGVERGSGFPGSTAGPFATIEFAAQNGINGIRLIGDAAGPVDDGSGFIGVTEFEVVGVKQELTLQVNSVTGLARIINKVQSNIVFDFYEVASPSGALDLSNWNRLEDLSDNPAGFPAGDGTGNGWEAFGNLDSSLVAEAFFEGSSQLAPGASVNLGDLFTIGSPDLSFRYLNVTTGEFVEAAVEYVTGGDYNNNGVVDAADYTVWRDNLGTSTPLSNDPIGGVIGPLQYEQWRASFGRATLAGTGRHQTSVPEPGSAVLLICGVMAGWQAIARAGMIRRRAMYLGDGGSQWSRTG